MKAFRSLIVIGTAIVLAVSAAAQGGGGQGQGRGFGRGMGMGNDPTGVFLLQQADVQKELNLTDDEKSKLSALRDKAQADMREIFQGANGDRDAMRASMTKYFAQMGKDAIAILTKEQAARLKEINIQLSGNLAAGFPDVQKDLGLSDDQVGKIKDLKAKQQEATQALFQKVQSQELTFQEMQDTQKKNNDTLIAEIGKVLTDAQKAKLKTMGGKEFKQDKAPGGGG